MAYYRALKDRYLEIRQIFRDEAPNVTGGSWAGTATRSRATTRKPAAAAPCSKHFADVLEVSDFQSVLAKQPYGNIDQVRRSVRILGKYGKVMVSAYGNKDKCRAR